ncbi:hypothetical protein ABTX81_12005 [Kitasatospora sp. NPDC097605]|uniref:hypothetical protein n=1 Tax=Kitasatospora sp. NPDC097605 TaxID=3157226 RepID=UPI00332028D5
MVDGRSRRIHPLTRIGLGGAWLPVTTGESGALVFRSADAARYATCVPAAGAADLTAERTGSGDLCLPSIVLDPRSLDVSGSVDLGRLGQADRHADLALLLANARETWTNELQAQAADTAFAESYGLVLDHDRLRFYLHLDPLTWG